MMDPLSKEGKGRAAGHKLIPIFAIVSNGPISSYKSRLTGACVGNNKVKTRQYEVNMIYDIILAINVVFQYRVGGYNSKKK